MNIIIIGASTGIGEALAHEYAKNGHYVAITARRLELLDKIALQYPGIIKAKAMDLLKIEDAEKTLLEIITEFGTVDQIIINAGVGFPKASRDEELQTVDVNVKGFTAMAILAHKFLTNQGHGTLGSVSSLAGIRSSPYSPEYHASKAYVSSYTQGLNYRATKAKSKVKAVDIRPGFVDTPMTKQNKGMFWVATPEKAAKQIYEGMAAQKKHIYVTKRYVLIAILLKILPDFLFTKFF